ncbi:(S)-N-methylcoclaurine 3'-hydroxylase isozyme 1 [Morus notabilis]|uniref:(S)-N-methylcoclaurine 3'-hydroxylase isozyme 1 n=1 Tax=Morus notabilis TaxID=981085 RepID=W9SLD8_9ROSA|nr:(S)-N-methylcoclaurine 3'-hydroxylase isozyme 1 [Morus notabilis]EXC34114.1 (S)-N-methylcoclaurine 3'-hydroxylase isozyme 1 [Morus notabilis]
MSPTVILFPQESNLLFPTLLIIFLPLIFFVAKRLKASFSRSPPLPPGPFPWPILGNIPHLKKEPLYVTLAGFAKTYGSDLISIKLGSQILIVGSSPAAAMEILKTHDRNLSARYVPHIIPAKNPELNNFSLGWTFECNDSWRNMRALCRAELFSVKALQSQASIREKKIMEMLEFIGKMEGKAMKFRDIIFASIFNMMSNIMVSRDFLNLELEYESVNGQGICAFWRELFGLGGIPNISDMYPMLGPLDLQKLRKKSMEMFGKVCELWDDIVKERKKMRKSYYKDASPRPQLDFLDAMLENGYPDFQINILLLELFSAGTDSSSTTVEWLMAELVRNPKCMKILREELEREIGSQEMVMECDLPKLKYLECCLKEPLRLPPPAPLPIPHRAAETCQVMNYTVPKNSEILVNVWAIGRDPNHWEDPLEFKPERFLNSSLDFKGTNFEYLPFGAGRRICPGQPLASKQVPLIVASLVHSFDWSLPNGKDPKELDMAEKYDINMLKKEPLLVVPKVRK